MSTLEKIILINQALLIKKNLRNSKVNRKNKTKQNKTKQKKKKKKNIQY